MHVDVIKLCAKKAKELETLIKALGIYSKHIEI